MPRPPSRTVNTPDGLQPQEQLFLIELNKCPENPALAAQRAGYAKPEAAAKALLNGTSHPKVYRAYQEQLEEKRRASTITAREIVEGLANIANFNIQDCIDADGKFLPLNKIPRHTAACLSEVKFTYLIMKNKKGETVRVPVPEVKSYSRLEAYKQLSAHLGLFKDVESQVTNVTNNTVNVNMNWGDLTAATSSEGKKKELSEKMHARTDVIKLPPMSEMENES